MLARRGEVEARSTPWASFRDLGRAAGSVAVGARLVEVAPGRQDGPLHAHGAEEELTYVLRGSGACVLEDGTGAAVREGDLVLRAPGAPAAALVAGEEGLEVVRFGERRDPHRLRLPRVDAIVSGGAWWPAGCGEPAFRREALLAHVEVPATLGRPSWVAACDDVEALEWGEGDVRSLRRDLGRATGSVRTGLKHVTVEPGVRGVVPHCHSAEEELFFVLLGEAVFEVGDERVVACAGDLVARPAGTGVAHSFLGGEEGAVLLAYGQRVTDDMCFYPRSQKVSLRGLGVRFTVTQVEYWDGER